MTPRIATMTSRVRGVSAGEAEADLRRAIAQGGAKWREPRIGTSLPVQRAHSRTHPDAMHAMQALSSGVRVAAKAARPAQRRTAVVVRAEGGIEKKVRL